MISLLARQSHNANGLRYNASSTFCKPITSRTNFFITKNRSFSTKSHSIWDLLGFNKESPAAEPPKSTVTHFTPSEPRRPPKKTPTVETKGIPLTQEYPGYLEGIATSESF